MPFENVKIRSLLNGATAVLGYREDLSADDVVLLSLLDTTTSAPPVASSYRWEVLGRDERSAAGGPGPEPILLGTGSSASFVVDDDTGGPRDCAYKIRCTLNGGSGTETHIEALLVRESGLTLTDGRKLRFLSAFEDLPDDASVPLVLAGWATMVNRWLRKIAELAMGTLTGPTLTEVLMNGDASPRTLGTIVKIDGDLTFTIANASSVGEPAGMVGVVVSPSIDYASAGDVATHGEAQVQFAAGLSLVDGQTAYLSTTDGMATNVPPDGDWIVPLGVIEDASTYSGSAGFLAIVKLQPTAGPWQLGRSVSGRAITTTADSVDGDGYNTGASLAIPLLDGRAYYAKLRAVGSAASVADVAMVERLGGAYRSGGGAVFVATAPQGEVTDNANGLDAKFGVVSNYLTVHLKQKRTGGYPDVGWSITVELVSVIPPAGGPPT